MKNLTIIFQPDGKRTLVEQGSTILNAAIQSGVDLISVCGGKSTCGKCKVIVNKSDAIEKPTQKEIETLTQQEIQNGIRLACCTKIIEDCTIKIPESSRTGKQRLQVEGINTPIKIEPSVKKYYVKIDAPTLEDPRADSERLLDYLNKLHSLNTSEFIFNFKLLQNLSKKLRDYDWECTIVLWRNEIIDVEPEDTTNRIFGYAVDIGTTKLAGYLVDLLNGNVLAANSAMNPQIPYGEDIISRLNYPEQETLQNVLYETLNKMLLDLLDKTGVKSEEVYEMTFVGNTVMHHIFLGIDPLYLGRSPYPPVVQQSIVINANIMNIKINPYGKIFALPTIAGFVGADTIGVILSSEIYKKDKLCIAIDIGTNTEIVLGNQDKLVAVSCASGPAFEGAHIKFGMRASSGAIEKIEIEPETLNVKYKTIDNEPPIGICGSGMIDLVAEMLKVGIIDVGGIFNANIKNSRIREVNEMMEFIVVPATESGTKEDITFSFKDVNQIVLAKAAIHTGFKLLFKSFNITKESLDTMYVAGAFGSHINNESARMIGVFPEIDLKKIKIIGNAAGTGARMCLVSDNAKKIAENLSKIVSYLELGIDEDFQRIFLNSNIIPYADLDEFPEMSEILKKNKNYPENPPPKF